MENMKGGWRAKKMSSEKMNSEGCGVAAAPRSSKRCAKLV
jgi:hypothetical protein